MGNFNQLDEIYITSSEKYKLIQSLLDKKLIKKIAPEIYTSRLEENPEDIVRKNLFQIIAEKFPGSLISHRSALELAPFQNHFFVTFKYTDKYVLPGLTINLLKGPGPVDGDNSLFGAIYSQRERAFLENMQISKSKVPKCLSQAMVEEKLESLMHTHGETYLNEIRDKARVLSKELSMDSEFLKLNGIIGAMLRTRGIKNLKSEVSKARLKNVPFDINRIKLFDKLFLSLHSKSFKKIPDSNTSAKSYALFAFFESYFSNYIEGTKFKVEDAKKVIDSGVPMAAREADSHDVLGTFKILSDKKTLSITAKSPDEFIELLKFRHKTLLSSRQGFFPGMFKENINVAGNTVFVEPELVNGTLIKGFEYYKALQEPFAKAAFMMFMIAEVHPFNDGNGRIARVFMNSELTKENQSKIIISTFFRDDYLLALKRFSRLHDPEVFIRMLVKAHEFSSQINGEDFQKVFSFLKQSNAFEEVSSIIIPDAIGEKRFPIPEENQQSKNNIAPGNKIPSIESIKGEPMDDKGISM